MHNIDAFFSGGGENENGEGGGAFAGFDINKIMAMFGGGGKSVEKERIIERTIVQQKIEYIPPQLAPFVNALEEAGKEVASTAEVERYKVLLTSDRIGKNGEDAIGILGNALRSPNKIIRKGAFESLKLVGTPEAKEVLTDYIRRARRRR